MPVTTSRWSRWSALICAMVFVPACGGPAPLTVDMPLHLEEHLDVATIVGSEVPANVPESIVWDFSEPQPDWKAPEHFNPTIPALILERTDDALRIVFDERHEDPRDLPLHGDIYVELPDLRREEWSHVLIRARASEGIRDINIGFNLIGRAEAEDLSLGMSRSTETGSPSWMTERSRPIASGRIGRTGRPIGRGRGAKWCTR